MPAQFIPMARATNGTRSLCCCPKRLSAPRILVKAITRPKPTGEVTKGGQYTQEQIAQALTKLEVRDYQDQGKCIWLMCAVHHAKAMAMHVSSSIEWCIGDPEYANDGEAVGRRWDSLHTKRQDGTITYKTLKEDTCRRGRGRRASRAGCIERFQRRSYRG